MALGSRFALIKAGKPNHSSLFFAILQKYAPFSQTSIPGIA
jgi:hypothetical protein